jgi:hypothetical protein
MFNNFISKIVLCEIMWENTAQPGRPQMTIWRMRIAWWIPKATDTHSQYVMLIVVPLQQCLHERASLLRYTYIDCIVNYEYYHPSEPFILLRLI